MNKYLLVFVAQMSAAVAVGLFILGQRYLDGAVGLHPFLSAYCSALAVLIPYAAVSKARMYNRNRRW